MQSRMRVALVVTTMLSGLSMDEAGAIDQIVGAMSPNGGAQLVKHFTPPVGSVIVGIEFLSNDLRTVFPRVALLQASAERTADASLMREARNVRAVDRHRVRVALTPITVTDMRGVYVAITFPMNDGVRALRDGPGLGATQLRTPTRSFIGSSDGTLQPIDLDLAIELVHETIGKSQPSEGGESARQATTFLRADSGNPSSGATLITFGLDRAGPAVLTLYDAAGRQVRNLVHESLSIGLHSRSWDGRNERGEPVATGVYIAKLRAGEKVLTQKLVLTR